ncbi:MAG: caspase family protein [Candidatus Omnitrophica bacterium]|nr:caspase family protein [Candidatus Omnitrophota bacterium]
MKMFKYLLLFTLCLCLWLPQAFSFSLCDNDSCSGQKREHTYRPPATSSGGGGSNSWTPPSNNNNNSGNDHHHDHDHDDDDDDGHHSSKPKINWEAIFREAALTAMKLATELIEQTGITISSPTPQINLSLWEHLTPGEQVHLADLAVATSTNPTVIHKGADGIIERRALIIGSNNYPSPTTDLWLGNHSMRNDAALAIDTLERSGYTIIHYENPTKEEIIAAVNSVSQLEDGDDETFIFMVGHALEDGVTKEIFGYAPYDYSEQYSEILIDNKLIRKDPIYRQIISPILETTAVSSEDMARELIQFDGDLVTMFDFCHAGSFNAYAAIDRITVDDEDTVNTPTTISISGSDRDHNEMISRCVDCTGFMYAVNLSGANTYALFSPFARRTLNNVQERQDTNGNSPISEIISNAFTDAYNSDQTLRDNGATIMENSTP